MNPSLILLAGQLLLKYGPDIAHAFVLLFHKPDPTLADWETLFAQVKTYDEYMAAAGVTAPAPTAIVPDATT